MWICLPMAWISDKEILNSVAKSSQLNSPRIGCWTSPMVAVSSVSAKSVVSVENIVDPTEEAEAES